MKYIGLNINSSKDIGGNILKDVEDCISKVFQDSEILVVQDAQGKDKDLLNKIDMMITLGGDGTIIRMGRMLYNHDIPIFGVNIGNLGFLASVEKHELEKALIEIKNQNFQVEERMLLNCEVIGGDKNLKCTSLNDIVLAKGALSRMMKYEIKVDGKLYAEFSADGVIASTPTGSTAYALSAGGPIIYPTLNLIEIVPICPQSPGLRPIILDPKSIIEVRIKDWKESAFLTIDGQEYIKLHENVCIRITQSGYKCKLVRLNDYDYFNVLRDKIIWRTREINCKGE